LASPAATGPRSARSPGWTALRGWVCNLYHHWPGL